MRSEQWVVEAKVATEGNMGGVASSALFIRTNCISLPLKVSMHLTKRPLETTERYMKDAMGWEFWSRLRKQPSPDYETPHAFALDPPFLL